MSKFEKPRYWRLKSLTIGLGLSSLACLGGIVAVSSSRGEATVSAVAANQLRKAQSAREALPSSDFTNRGTLLPFYQGNQGEANIDVFYDNETGCEYFVINRNLRIQVVPRLGADGEPNGCGNV